MNIMNIILKCIGSMGLSGLAIGGMDKLTSNDSLSNGVVLLLREWGVVSKDFANYIVVSGNGDQIMWMMSTALVLLAVYKELPKIIPFLFDILTNILLIFVKIAEKYTVAGRVKSNELREKLLLSKINQIELQKKLDMVKNEKQ